MIQLNSNRLEEYITLREELIQSLAHSRNILNATATFMVASFAWYFGQAHEGRIAVSGFAIFLYLVLMLSMLLYTVTANQAFRVGAYIAVFWESRDSDRRLAWHRLNRRGPSGSFRIPNVASIVYFTAGVTVSALLGQSILARTARQFEPLVTVAMVGFVQIFLSLNISRYLREQRNYFEREWRRISESPALQSQIHDDYETIPSRIMLP